MNMPSAFRLAIAATLIVVLSRASFSRQNSVKSVIAGSGSVALAVVCTP
jgi:hypothetical protein